MCMDSTILCSRGTGCDRNKEWLLMFRVLSLWCWQCPKMTLWRQCTALTTELYTINGQVFWYVQYFNEALKRKHFSFRNRGKFLQSIELWGVTANCTERDSCILGLVYTLSAVDGKMLFRCIDLHYCQCFLSPWVFLGVTQGSNTESRSHP